MTPIRRSRIVWIVSSQHIDGRASGTFCSDRARDNKPWNNKKSTSNFPMMFAREPTPIPTSGGLSHLCLAGKFRLYSCYAPHRRSGKLGPERKVIIKSKSFCDSLLCFNCATNEFWRDFNRVSFVLRRGPGASSEIKPGAVTPAINKEGKSENDNEGQLIRGVAPWHLG